MGKRIKKSRYISGLDGLRAIAVIAVILYHLAPFKFQGGFLGVPIFFVVSGYLITDLLLMEYQQNGTIDVVGFYVRRMKRLYPGLLAALLGVSAYVTLLVPGFIKNLKQVVAANMLYVYNWYQVFHHESYFDKFGNQSPFTHLWSLSIEGQFYLVWPLLVLILLKVIKHRQPIVDLILGLILFSALEMVFLYQPQLDPSRVYYGTDTRMFAILMGACLAFVWPSAALKRTLPAKPRLVLDVIGLGAFLAIILMFMKMIGQNGLVYRGGMFFLTLAAVILVATVVHPGADMNAIFTNPLFHWIGTRSYGIYLYQYPVMIFYENKVHSIGDHPVLNGLIEVTIILVISELSYRYLERPLQHFDYRHPFDFIREIIKKDSVYGWKRVWVAVFLAIFVTGVVGLLAPSSQMESSKVDSSQQLAKQIAKNKKQIAKNNKAAKQASTNPANSQPKKTQTALTPAEQQKAQTLAVTCVGDSVMADAAPKIQAIFPQMYVDAKVGRQVAEIIPLLSSLAQAGKLADKVLISEGTNGPYDEDTMAQIMQILGSKRQVYWINVFVPTRSWQDQVNNDLKRDQKKYHNLKVIDWYNYSKNHADWFYEDHIHPNPTGAEHFSTFTAKHILQD
ncbi:peptidoglycan-N-acetylmuramate O-acetyltransferase [Ligilactobacillus sp. WC1T17]|uniref:Peptidoglycan-N-acetylmuramate O-acetyltransferase n=1 Tax=Ligilactobacillus ruminis TaxID=1623 RepID=A0ABY1A9L3_9LACO|nr:peptidoglycan-N-acetylmuramate O-acetyltransferase [Ligilactobacillus ruminis]